jgi:hypothetical protein
MHIVDSVSVFGFSLLALVLPFWRVQHYRLFFLFAQTYLNHHRLSNVSDYLC